MKNNNIKIFFIVSTIIFTLISITAIVLNNNGLFNQNNYTQSDSYTFSCYNKNRMIISGYGFAYRNKRIFDGREQKLITLPDDCAVFKFEE